MSEIGKTANVKHLNERVRGLAFWSLALVLAFFLFAASAPSPLYAVYQSLWHFSPITLTVIYAVYAGGALVALLIGGRLSDHLGRRPVLLLALLVQIAGMAAFILAQDVSMLYLARVLQGAATGIAGGTISAWLLDLQPSNDPRLGSLVGGIAPIAGLGAGALGAGLLVQYGPDPQHLVFWLLIVVYAAALALSVLMPDFARRSPGWLQSMRPQVGIPMNARARFLVLLPSFIAIWALGGLYLSLGPSLATSLLHSQSYIAGGLVIVSLLGTGAVASAFSRDVDPRVLIIWGSLVLVLGVGITLLAVAFASPFALYAGTIVAGLGFGPAFSGVFRDLASLAPPDKRGAMVAAMYIVLYVSFSIPAIIAGIGVTRYGLPGTAIGFGLVVMGLGVVTAVGMVRRPVQAPASV